MFHCKSLIFSAGIVAAASVMPSASMAEIFKGETAGAGVPVHAMFVAFTSQAGKAGVEIQVNAGQTLTKSMLRGGRGEIDFFSSVPSLVNLMKNQARMYENVDDAAAAAAQLRSILDFKAGAYHPVTLAGSGIETWEDLKGKTVFTGPPAGSASATSEALIKIITGYEAGTDYTAVRLAWGEGYAALADGKIDMMVRPAEIGSAKIGWLLETPILRVQNEKSMSESAVQPVQLANGTGPTVPQASLPSSARSINAVVSPMPYNAMNTPKRGPWLEPRSTS